MRCNHIRVATLANIPLWTIPGLEHLKHGRHYATWLEPLIPAFEEFTGDFDIHWVTLSKEAKQRITHRAFGQTFHIIPRGPLSVSMMSGFVVESLQVRRVFRSIQPDVLHVWGSEDGYAWLGAWSGIQTRLFTLQGFLNGYVRLLGGSSLFRLQALYERMAVRRYCFGTAESPTAKAALIELNPSINASLVDYGVNREFFKAGWNPSEKPNIVFVGGISERKGIRDLINVAIRPEFAQIQFYILGEGPLKAELSGIAGTNVKWRGACSRSEVVEALERAWGLVIPTYADTGPTVVKEARVVGVPIITTTTAGASSYVVSAGCGRVIEPGDNDALAKAILELCHSREACVQLGNKGREEHRRILDPTFTTKEFIETYKKLMEWKQKHVGTV